MVYRGFTWNLTAGDVEILLLLLDQVERTSPYKIDRKVAASFRERAENWLELTPDGSSTTHGCADS